MIVKVIITMEIGGSRCSEPIGVMWDTRDYPELLEDKLRAVSRAVYNTILSMSETITQARTEIMGDAR